MGPFPAVPVAAGSEVKRLSRVPGPPSCLHALLLDPGEASRRDPSMPTDTAFRLENNVGPHNLSDVGAESHGLQTPCVHFTWRDRSPKRNTRSSLGVVQRAGLGPAGWLRRVFVYDFPPSQAFSAYSQR